MRFRLLLSVSWLLSAFFPATAADDAPRYCYRIFVDGGDRSLYQYVNERLVTFADPSWKQDPAVEDVRLVDLETGRPEPPPVIQRANYIASRPWGGVMFPHIQPGKVLSLRAGGRLVTFQRAGPGGNCPHPDFRLDNRMLGYEVLQHCPFEIYIGLGALGSRVHLEGKEVILKIDLVFSQCTATLHSGGSGEGRPFPIHRFAGLALIGRYPHLRKLIQYEWGLLSSCLVFPSLDAGDELRVVVTLPGGERPIPFFVRKIDERDR